MASIDFDLVRHALNVARDSEMHEVELELGDAKFSAVMVQARAKQQAQVQEALTSASQEAPIGPLTKPIKAASVGIFRSAKEPVVAGMTLEKGDVVGTILALGISNDILANSSGTVSEILVEDGDPVEFGQTVVEVLA